VAFSKIQAYGLTLFSISLCCEIIQATHPVKFYIWRIPAIPVFFGAPKLSKGQNEFPHYRVLSQFDQMCAATPHHKGILKIKTDLFTLYDPICIPAKLKKD